MPNARKGRATRPDPAAGAEGEKDWKYTVALSQATRRAVAVLLAVRSATTKQTPKDVRTFFEELVTRELDTAAKRGELPSAIWPAKGRGRGQGTE